MSYRSMTVYKVMTRGEYPNDEKDVVVATFADGKHATDYVELKSRMERKKYKIEVEVRNVGSGRAK